jgi:hypothetical protein
VTTSGTTRGKPGRRSTIDAAAIVFITAMAVLAFVTLARMTLLGDHGGNSPAVMISEIIAITAGATAVVFTLIEAHQEP